MGVASLTEGRQADRLFGLPCDTNCIKSPRGLPVRRTQV